MEEVRLLRLFVEQDDPEPHVFLAFLSDSEMEAVNRLGEIYSVRTVNYIFDVERCQNIIEESFMDESATELVPST